MILFYFLFIEFHYVLRIRGTGRANTNTPSRDVKPPIIWTFYRNILIVFFLPHLSKSSSRCVLSRPDSSDAHEAPPKAVIKTPVLITALLGKENQTDAKKMFILKNLDVITLPEWGHRHRSEPSEDWSLYKLVLMSTTDFGVQRNVSLAEIRIGLMQQFNCIIH